VRRIVAVFVVLVSLLVLPAQASAKRPPRGAEISDVIVKTWDCQDQLHVPRTPATRSPWKLKGHSPGYRSWLLNTWQGRHKSCYAQLVELRRQWNWQSWLPDKWRRIGICETQLNWQHSNSSYQGAFGFAVSSWDAFKLPGYPDEAWQATPWQQYQVALAIFRRYGLSGWGCRNA
jgi:hypothetical protein